MKIKDVAHNHSLTDLLKVSIFSLLMLAPMINVGVRSAYVVCNKNAYQSYYGETINEIITEEVTNNTLVNNVEYLNIYDSSKISTTSDWIYVTQVKQINWAGSPVANINNNIDKIYRFRNYFNINNNNASLQVTFNDNGTDYTANIQSIKFINYNNVTLTNFTTELYKITYNKFSYLDNVFEYSVSQLTESPLYNWVENTAIYSGVALMNTQLGITQPVISLLVVYWLLLTIIYIIIDIVIHVFTWLTHMIGSKTA